MRDIINAEVYRLKKSKLFWGIIIYVFIIFIAAYHIDLEGGAEGEKMISSASQLFELQNGYALFVSQIFFAAIRASQFISDYKSGYVKDVVGYGNNRFQFWLPALLCCAPSFLVTASGNVYPCQKLERDEYLLGNIRERSIKEMAESELFRKVKFSLGIDTNNKCAGCEFKYLCTFKGGLCKKDVYPKEANCREYNIEMLYLQTIYKR